MKLKYMPSLNFDKKPILKGFYKNHIRICKDNLMLFGSTHDLT